MSKFMIPIGDKVYLKHSKTCYDRRTGIVVGHTPNGRYEVALDARTRKKNGPTGYPKLVTDEEETIVVNHKTIQN